MNSGSPNLNVGGLAFGFGAGALVVILLMWIGGGMFYGGRMFHGGGMMGQGTMWSNGGMGSIGAAILFIASAAIIGALVAIVHNAVARK
jgi:hypothetical protein